MIKTIFLATFGFCFLVSFPSFGQEAIETPQRFGQFYNNPMMNIARNGLNSKIEARLDNQRTSGGFAGSSTSYASFLYNSSTRKHKNIYGFYVYNDNEGDFISRRRALLSYSRHQKISKNVFLSVGLSSGIYLFAIKPSKTTGAFSANSFEGNASLLLYSKKSQIGLSVNQFSNSTIQPASQILRLARHYYLFGQQDYEIYSNLKMSSNAFVQYMNVASNSNPNKLNFGFSQRIYLNIILVGASIERDAATAIIGLNNIKFGENTIDFDFSYRLPFARTNAINVNLLELHLKYRLIKDKGVTF